MPLFKLPEFMDRKDLSLLIFMMHMMISFKLRLELQLRDAERMTNTLYNLFFSTPPKHMYTFIPIVRLKRKKFTIT